MKITPRMTKLEQNYNFAKDNLEDSIYNANELIKTSCSGKLLIAQIKFLTHVLNDFKGAFKDYHDDMKKEIENSKNAVIRGLRENKMFAVNGSSCDLMFEAENCITKLDEKLKEAENA